MATGSANRNNEESFLFNLNVVPAISESNDERIEFFLNGISSNPPDLQPNFEMEGPIPMIITPSSEGTLLLDLNVDPNQEFESPILELEVGQVQEEDEDVLAPNLENFEASQVRKEKKNLSNGQRWAIYNALLARSVNGKLKRHTTKEVSALFSVPIRTVQRVWKRAKETSQGEAVDVSHRRTGNCGRKRVQIDLNRVVGIPLHKRTTLRTLAENLKVSYTTLFRFVNRGLIRRHSNALKPYLKEEHKRARLQFCISMLDANSLSREPMFVSMYNMVHIDEKWFYMTKKCETYYLLPTEEEPLRTCQSKNYIGKVMFLVAMAHPRFDDKGNEVFSGKIGVFPFVNMQPAQRRSRNRDAGTLEIKPITSIKRETIKTYLIEKVIPKIQDLWPREDLGKTIYIQQDNARTHVDPNDAEFQMAASQNGFDIRLVCQPPNSPDLNILDLGFFSAIQALQHKECPRNVEDLIHAVQKSFDEYPTRKVDHVFLTLQLCMREIMKVGGSNKYKIPHVNKAALEKEGRLPTQITCDLDVVQNVKNMLA